MQSGFDINQLLQEAQKRWLKPAEVLFILQNHANYQITAEAPQKPPSGSLYLFNKRVLRFFRKDGHNWRKKKDGRTVGEAHERLKVGNAEALNCYYAHGEDNPSFQRRSYWMLEPAFEHIVLVHYRETSEGKLSPGSISDPSPGSSAALSQSTNSYAMQNSGSSSLSDSYQNHLSPSSLEVNSDTTTGKPLNYLNGSTATDNAGVMSESDVSQALRRLEMQLSLDDDSLKGYVPPDDVAGNEEKFGILDDPYSRYPGIPSQSNVLPSQPGSGYNKVTQHFSQSVEQNTMIGASLSWNDVLGFPSNCQQLQPDGLDGKKANDMNSRGTNSSSIGVQEQEQESHKAKLFKANNGIEAAEGLSRLAHSSQMYPVSSELSMMLLDPTVEMSVTTDSSLTIAKEQRFTIREICPEWGFANVSTKVIIVGSFLCDPSDCTWHCMFGDIEVPLQILRDGVFTCQAPPCLPGKVTLCITSGNRESCSEIRDFEYRTKHSPCPHCDNREGTSKSTEEMLLLVRLVKMLLSNSHANQGESNELEADPWMNEKGVDDSLDQIMEALLVGGGTSTATLDWLLEQLIKDKLQHWLSSRTTEGIDSSLSRKEQGVIHMIAGLGYEWALNPLLENGVGVNFRDINGWTALHWAARFGREKMVAALIASGASALAVTDPSANDPTGRTAAYIAAASGHKGLAGYLSEVALTSHLSSLTVEETELSKGTADVEAELTVTNISKENAKSHEDQVSMKHTLAAVRNAAQAAARIQAAFRAHSFRKRQQGEVSGSDTFTSVDEYGFTLSDSHGISAASKLAFHNPHYNHKAALSIQKNYRGWKGRKDFVSLRQKVVKIQAHVRGYQVRKKYRVICWAVGILDKAVLRWRRKGPGLRGFKPEADVLDEEDEDEDVIKVFRKEKVNVAIDEAVSRVLSMVESPEARQQYQRMLGKFQEAKAARQSQTSSHPSSSQDGISSMDNDQFLLSDMIDEDFLTFP